jgi:hypothetical protein
MDIQAAMTSGGITGRGIGPDRAGHRFRIVSAPPPIRASPQAPHNIRLASTHRRRRAWAVASCTGAQQGAPILGPPQSQVAAWVAAEPVEVQASSAKSFPWLLGAFSEGGHIQLPCRLRVHAVVHVSTRATLRPRHPEHFWYPRRPTPERSRYPSLAGSENPGRNGRGRRGHGHQRAPNHHHQHARRRLLPPVPKTGRRRHGEGRANGSQAERVTP